MDLETQKLKIVLLLTIGFSFASVLGFLSQRVKLSPILGYLLAGYLIGPFSPGFVVDLKVSEQLAEIGVILMMFGVGLHFKWKDLVNVKNIAIPGAVVQTFVTAIVSALLVYSIGWPLSSGVIIGVAIGVASTVVLVRVLLDNNLLSTIEGHIAIGWLVVEDILTVLVLIVLPSVAKTLSGEAFSLQAFTFSIVLALLKFGLLAIILFTIGKKVVGYILNKIAQTRSHELFTLTVLALIFVIATGSTYLFGTSIALGAFIAGMVIGQTNVRHQASANSLSMKDTFVVIFFLSIGMLFNPQAIVNHFSLFLGVFGIILILKPLVAILIVLLLRHTVKTALTIAFALAQIGEFSFILAEEALKFNLIPEAGYDIIVACALITISINPVLFIFIERLMSYVAKKVGPMLRQQIIPSSQTVSKAIVVGYGPVGQSAVETLEKHGITPIIIERNVDVIEKLVEENRHVIYGDASHPKILEASHVETVKFIVITTPDITSTVDIANISQQLNPKAQILARMQYASDEHLLDRLGIKFVCSEVETIKAFNKALNEMIS